MSDDDRALEEALGRALDPRPEPTPHPDRVAALRAQAEDRARHHHAAGDHPRVVASTPRADRKRRDMLVGGIAASIGAVLGVSGAVVAESDDDGPDPAATEQVTFASPAAGVTTEASLIDHTWGLELLLDVAGLPAERDYQVRYRSTRGDAVGAGSFRSVADTLMRCRFNAALLRGDTTAITVIDPDGSEVLRADLA